MTPQSPNAVRKVIASLVAALDADPALQAILGATDAAPKVFAGRAPVETPFPFISISDSPSESVATFTGTLCRGESRVHLWGTDYDAILELWEHFQRITDRVPLALETGFTMRSANVRLITAFADPSVSGGYQGVANYAWAAQFEADA